MNSMMEIIEWLIKIEKLAAELYLKAAEYFEDEKELKEFLQHCESDESLHYLTMVSAAEFIRNNGNLESSISLDEEIKMKVESPLNKALGMIDDRSLTREMLAWLILEAELSEWNHLFIYVIRSLLKVNRLFISSAAVIQGHLKSIENFFRILPEGEKYLSELGKIPSALEERVLVVDDDEVNADIVEAMLHDYNIEKAYNGREAIDLLRNGYYKVIISDIDMPVMNGIRLLNESEKEFPGIKERFIFFTGDHSEERLKYFNDNKLNYMLKPVTVNELRKKTLDVMEQNMGIKRI